MAVGAARGGDRPLKGIGEKKRKKKRIDPTVIVLFFRAGGRTKIAGELLERANFPRTRDITTV